MKKKLSFLCALLLLTAGVAMGQYQVPNNTFEGDWYDNNKVPDGWHSFSHSEGSVAGTAGRTNYSSRVGGHSGNYSCKIQSHGVLFGAIVANGTITTGQIMVNSTSTSGEENRNITDKDNSEGHDGYYAFTGRPDSLRLWCAFFIPKKTGWGSATNRSFTASLKFHLHGDVEYVDHLNIHQNTPQDGKIANVYGEMTSPTHSNASDWTSEWSEFKFPVKYFSGSTGSTPQSSPNLNNTSEPSYLLASFSTNKDIGGGKVDDGLLIDDIWFVYNKKLSSLVVGSNTLSSTQINTLNNAAYTLANGTTTNTFASSLSEDDYPTYEYTSSICAPELETINIAASAQSGFATVTLQSRATVDNPYALIKVTHTDNSKYYFRVYFSNIVSVEQPTISGATSACDNGSVTLTASSTTSGASYVWYNGETQVGTSATYTPSYSNVTSQTNYTYTCKALKGECSSTAASHTITVNPLPTVSISASSTSVCAPNTISLTANGANNYTWTGIEASGSSATVSGVGTYNVTVTGTNTTTNCSNTASTTVTVNPLPTITITPSATSVCAPNTITLTAGGADSYTWSNGLGSDAQATVSNESTNTVTYTVTVTGTNTTTTCSNTATQSVTIKMRPTVTISGDTSLCTGDPITLTAYSQTGVSFDWSDESHNATLEVSTGGTYSVTGTLDGCVSESVSHHVSEYEVPTITSVTPGARCGEGTVTLEAASSSNSTCYWYATATTSESLGTGNSYTTNNLSQSHDYYVQARNAGGCASERTVVAATVNPAPNSPEVTNITNCGAGDFTLTASVPEGVSLQWFADEDAAQPLPSENVSVNATTTYYVRSHNDNCNSSVVPLTITINPIPDKPTNITSTPVCGSGQSNISATPASGCVLNWFAVKDVNATPISQANPYITPQLSQSRKYYVLSKNTTTMCVSEMDSVTVNVYPIPELPNVQNTTLCAMGEVTLEGTPGDGATTLRWYSEDGVTLLATGNTYNVTISAATTKFKVASYNAEVGCEGDKREITVTVSATIPAPEAASTVYACGGSAVLTATAGSGSTIQWYDASDSELSTGSTLSVSDIANNITYKVSAKVGNCESAKTTVTVVPATVPQQPIVSDVSRCGAGEITLTATVGEGFACRWYADNVTETVLSSDTAYTTNINITTTYYVAAINETTQCVSARKSVQAQVKQLPATPITTPVAYCGAGTYTLTANANGNTEGVFHWYSDEAGTQEIQNTLEIDETGTYYVAWMDNQPCRSALASMVVTINPKPEMPTATAPDPFCSNGAVQVTLTATPGNNGNACRWYDANQAYLNVQNNTYGRNLNASTTYYVSTYNTTTNCESDLKAMPVVINAIPDQVTVSNQSRCGEGAVTFSGEVTEPNTLKWYSMDDELLHTGSLYMTASLSDNTSFKVTTANPTTGCESAPVTVTATVYPDLAAPTVTSPQNLCGTGTINLTAETVEGCSLRWFADANGEEELTANANGSYTTSTLEEGQTYTYYVLASNANCSGPMASIEVRVYAQPTIENVTDANRCGAGDVQLSAVASTDAQVRWYENNADETPIFTGNMLSCSNIEETTIRYAEAYNSTTGCYSSRVPVTAYVYDTYTLNDPKVACDSLVWNGQTYYQSGDYQNTLTSIHDCDSIVTLQLTINNTQRKTVDTTVCNSITWNGHTYTQSGVYIDTLTAACNCDSIVTLNLTVNYSSSATDQLVLCSNQLPYDYNGTNIESAGVKTITIPNAMGCDSVITLTVVVNPQPEVATLTPTSRCGAGNVMLAAGTGTNGTTCYWYADAETMDTVHSGTSYQLSLESTTTYYVASVNTVTGCMSARQPVTATVNPVPAAPQVSDTTRCGAGPVMLAVAIDDPTWMVRWYANTATQQVLNTGLQYDLGNRPVSVVTYYVESVDATTNCKSARTPITATVYALPAQPTVTPIAYCGPNSFNLSANNTTSCRWYESANDETPVSEEATFATGTVNESRSYYVSNINATTGCESEKTEFPITIYPVYEPVDLYDTTCQGSVYTQYGLNYNCEESGEQEIVLATTSMNNCDSLVTLHLYVNEKKYMTLMETACDSYEWDGTTYTLSTTDVKTYTAANGCDSIVTLNLTINYSASTPLTQTTCQNDEPYHYVNGQQIDTTFDVYNPGVSTYTFLRHTVQNCDSVITLTLTVLPKVETVLNEVACDSYVWDGTTYTSSTTDTKTYMAANGCDSVVTLNLTVNHSSNVLLTDTVCAGTEYNRYGFDTTITSPNNYILTHQGTNVDGCDSVTTLTLTVTPVYNRTITSMICSGGSYPFNGENLTEAGTYVASLQTVNGCDSVVTLNLTVGDQFRDTITAHVCAGGSYNANNFNITNATSTQFYENSGYSASGCDSTMVLHLIVHDLNTTNLNGAICLGETYALNGFNVTPSTVGDTTVIRVVQTQYNCDSTVVLHLTVNPVYNLTDTVVTCQSETPYHYDAENVDLAVSTPGTRTIRYEHQTVAGCDSNLTLTLIVNPVYYQTVALATCQSENLYHYDAENADLDVSVPGVYTFEYSHLTATNCDSIITLTLTVNETKALTVEGSICLGESYTENGFNVTPTMVGDTQVVRTLQTAQHCDSVVTLNLTVNQVFALKDTVETCQSETPYHYDAENVDLNVSAVGTQNIVYEHQTAAGCDSNLTLTLIVHPISHTTIPLSVCQSEIPFVYENGAIDTTFDVSEPRQVTVDYHFQTVNNCDSIITLNLTVNPSFSTDTTVSVCDVELPYIWNNDPQYSYNESGDYQIVYELETGCDSIINLHLNVHQSFETDTIIQICQEGLPYAFDANHVFQSQGNYTVELTSPFGCDSIYHIQLVVTPAITHTVTRNICDSDLPFSFGDSLFTQAGQYEVIASRTDGCNEITYLTLNVYPAYQQEATHTICESQLPYTVGDSIFTEAGVKTVHFRTAHSCDSAVTVTLIVNPEYAVADADTVCQSEIPYHYVAENIDLDISVAGVRTYTYEHTTAAGCDSTVTFTLTVLPAYTGTRSVTLCANSDQLPYSFGDALLTTSGVYTYNFHTVDGCDSIETLTFTVKPVFDTTITASICQGDSYVENGFNLTPDSVGTHTYTQNFISSLDCDSTVNLVLTVNPTYYFIENEMVHSTMLPFRWHGREFNESTTVYDSLTTIAGCDSIHHLILTVTEFNVVNDNPITMCSGETQMWRGREISESGTYTDTVVSSNTIYMVNVTVNPSYHLTDTMEVCDTELPTLWHERWFTGDTTMVVNYQTAATYCDSIYTLTFIVHPTYNMHEDTSVCENALPIEWHGQSISVPGNYADSLQTSFGCDSVFTLTVNVTYVTTQEDSMTVCGADETYAWHGMTLSETGLYSDTLRNANGCDSIVYTMNFVKGMPFLDADTVDLTDSVFPYIWHEQTINAAGIYYDSLTTQLGCDSIYSLYVYFGEWTHIESAPIMLCPGDSITWHDMVISDAGTYTDTVIRWDARIIYGVTVTMNNAYYYNDTVTICQNELPYIWHDMSLTASGVTELPLQTVNGCDSIYRLTLIVNPSYSFVENVTICSNELPFPWRGRNLEASGVYYDSLTTQVGGCDSVYQLNLTVNPAVRQNDTATTCRGIAYIWRGQSLQESGFYTDTIPNGACQDIYTLFLTVNEPIYDTLYEAICLGDTYNQYGFDVTPEFVGLSTYQQNLTAENGCDSVITLFLTVNASYLFETTASTCDNTPYEWRNFVCAVSGVYYDSLQTTTGCDSVYVLYLTVNPTYEIYLTDTAQVNVPYDNYGFQLTPTELGVSEHTLVKYTVNGCDSVIHLSLFVSVGVEDYVAPQLRVYPVPAETYVNIEGEHMAKVFLYDMHGRLIQMQDADTPEYTRLFFETQTTGFYILKIQLMDGALVTKKIVVKHF